MKSRNEPLRGFAVMDKVKQRAIARKGGLAAHEKGVAHTFTSEEARKAGRRGGKSVSVNRHHMSKIGRAGGKKSAESRRFGRAKTDMGPH